jgi:arylformamidase
LVRRSSLLDVSFGSTIEETLDIFPAQDPDAPILVFIHGGYWRSNSSKEFSWVALGPVALGFTVVITNYALCPKVTLPEITRQSRAAIAWVEQNVQR